MYNMEKRLISIVTVNEIEFGFMPDKGPINVFI